MARPNSDIQRIERFRFDGREFARLADVAQHIEDALGSIIDSVPNRLAPADRLAILHVLIQHRARLVQLLSATYMVDATELQPEAKSIFDFVK